ncbi:hypothetical protein [Williamsia sp. R60]
MSNSKPWWLRGIQAVDSKAGPLLEGVTTHEAFAVGMTVVSRGRRGVERRIERLSRHILHGLNLPTATDQNRLLIQLAAVEHRVRKLGKELDDARTDDTEEVRDGLPRSVERARQDNN